MGGMNKQMKMAVMLGVVIAAVSTGCNAADTKSATPKKVTYEVTGTTTASITYTDGGTKTSQETEAKIPWTKTIKATEGAIVYQVSAQNGTQTSKKVACTISVDGKVVDRNVGKGQFAIASCEYQP